MTDTKRCRKCGRDLPLDQFPYCTSTYKGQKKKYRSSPCPDCHNLANLIWHERTLETRRAARTAAPWEMRATIEQLEAEVNDLLWALGALVEDALLRELCGYPRL